MVIAVIIVTFGLYMLLQPRFRQITLPIFDRQPQPESQPKQNATTTTKTVKQTTVITPTPQAQPTSPQPDTNVSATSGIVRPPRLNIPSTTTHVAPVPRVPLTSTQPPHITPEAEYADIRAVFESAGFVYKGMPRIRGVQTATIAIGTDEVLWIGAVGVKMTDMQRAVQTLSGVFSDTLDDIEININAFVIAPTDTDETSDIMRFTDINELREYIMAHPNTPPSADDSENFDAYSGYIGTVIDYIGKI